MIVIEVRERERVREHDLLVLKFEFPTHPLREIFLSSQFARITPLFTRTYLAIHFLSRSSLSSGKNGIVSLSRSPRKLVD